MAKIIKLKQGDVVPAGAKFLYAKEEKENGRIVAQFWQPSLEEIFTLGMYYKTRQQWKHDLVTYFFYEVES